MRTTSRSRFAVVGMAMAALLLTLGLPFPQSAAAATFNVNVASNTFTPQDLGNITAGDTITWTRTAGTHDTTSASIPAGATAWVSPTLNATTTTFSMVFTVAGNYRYFCSIHSDAATADAATQSPTSQVGQFTVVAATTPTPTPTPTPGVSPIAPPSPSPSAPPSPSASPSTIPPSAAPSPSTIPPSAAPAPSGNSGGSAPVSSAKPRPPATDALVDLPGDMPGLAVLALALALIGSVVIALGIESVRGVARRRPGR